MLSRLESDGITSRAPVTDSLCGGQDAFKIGASPRVGIAILQIKMEMDMEKEKEWEGKWKEWLKQAEEVVEMAVKEASAVNSGFTGRWRNISNKLERLKSMLSRMPVPLASPPSSFYSDNGICKEALQSVIATLQDVLCLAHSKSGSSCHYPCGKLQMQSNLDSLAAKLDLNLHDCSLLLLLFSSGANNSNLKIEWSIKELVARLQMGDMESKSRALDALLQSDEKQVSMALRSGRGTLQTLIQLLSASSPRIREKAATLVCSMLSHDAHDFFACSDSDGNPQDYHQCNVDDDGCQKLWEVMEEEGAVAPLVRLLECGSPLAKQKAAISLQTLSARSSQFALSVAAHAAISPLFELSQLSSASPIAAAAASATLTNLAVVPELRQTLAQEGIVGLMLEFLRSQSSQQSQKKSAAQCLQYLTCGNEALRRRVVADGGISCLLNYIDYCCDHMNSVDAAAVAALRNLALSSSCAPSALISAGILHRILRVLALGPDCGYPQELAVALICRICSYEANRDSTNVTNEVRKEVGESGCMIHIVKMLCNCRGRVQEIAATALLSLVSVPSNCRELRRQENASIVIPALLQCLCVGTEQQKQRHGVSRKQAISLLLCLSCSKKCRKMMVSLGVPLSLKKMVSSEMEMEDVNVVAVNKLLDRLQRTKFSTLLLILSRKYH